MFAGIVEREGRVVGVAAEGGARRLVIETGLDGLQLGESLAVDGVCLTVAAIDGTRAAFFVSGETLARSGLGGLSDGRWVNLERALTLSSRLSGHLVQGHVDGRARLTAVRAEGEARRLELTLPAPLRRYCVEKGSIALGGVSLTLNAVGEPDAAGGFAIAITVIPHTWSHTNLGRLEIGDELNVEVDVLAKYVENLCRPLLAPSRP